jgi:hypothetical protein
MLQEYGLLPLVGYTEKAVRNRKHNGLFYAVYWCDLGCQQKKCKNNGYFLQGTLTKSQLFG